MTKPKTTKPIVLVDMDGVLADFDHATEAFLQKNHPHIQFAGRQSFYLHQDYPEYKDIVAVCHTKLGFFSNLPPIEGALAGWQKLKDLGFHPRICSSPLLSHPDCINEKKLWVEKHLGIEAAEEAIIDVDKTGHHGIALIDDKPEITGSHQPSWRHIVFDQSYNRTIDTDLRIHGWDDPNLASTLDYCRELHQP